MVLMMSCVAHCGCKHNAAWSVSRQEPALKAVGCLQMGEKDLQEDETKQYVADLLNQQIEHPDFQLNPEQVTP